MTPIRDDSRPVGEHTGAMEQPVHLPRERGTILVADDHAPSRQALARLLTLLGYPVVQAKDGAEAIELAQTTRPRLAILDLHMPRIDGVEAASTIKRDPTLAGISILALTGDDSLENRRRIDRIGVDGTLIKPITLAALTRAIHHIIGSE